MLQRRTFLGGLLAAVATATVHGRVAIDPASIAVAEQKILANIPEPEEGFHLLINPGYGLPRMRGVSAMPVANPNIPADPEFLIHMRRPSFLSNEWTGKIKPVVYDEYRRCCLQLKVEGDDVMTAHNWITRVMDSYQSSYLSVRKSDYVGTGTFGQPGKDPIIKFEGLFPTSVQTELDGKKMIASVELSFDWVQQSVL